MFKTKVINNCFTENLLKNTCHFTDVILLTFKYYKVAIVMTLQMKK